MVRQKLAWSFSSDNLLSIPLVLMDEYTNIFYMQLINQRRKKKAGIL